MTWHYSTFADGGVSANLEEGIVSVKRDVDIDNETLAKAIAMLTAAAEGLTNPRISIQSEHWQPVQVYGTRPLTDEERARVTDEADRRRRRDEYMKAFPG